MWQLTASLKGRLCGFDSIGGIDMSCGKITIKAELNTTQGCMSARKCCDR